MARIWDTRTGTLVRTFTGHRDALTSVQFSPDGKLLLTTSRDHDARIWDVETGKPTVLLRGHFGPVFGASFSPDQRWVVTAGPSTAGLWQASNGRLLFFPARPQGTFDQRVVQPGRPPDPHLQPRRDAFAPTAANCVRAWTNSSYSRKPASPLCRDCSHRPNARVTSRPERKACVSGRLGRRHHIRRNARRRQARTARGARLQAPLARADDIGVRLGPGAGRARLRSHRPDVVGGRARARAGRGSLLTGRPPAARWCPCRPAAAPARDAGRRCPARPDAGTRSRASVVGAGAGLAPARSLRTLRRG